MLPLRENNDASFTGNVRTGGTPQVIIGWSFKFMIFDLSGVGFVTKLSSDSTQIEVLDAATGKIKVYIKPADTLGHAGRAKYELQGTDSAGRQYTLDSGEVVIAATLIR
jgi:hypothetical protein